MISELSTKNNTKTTKTNTKSTSNIRNDVNDLFCKGFPIRNAFAILILCLNVLNLLFGYYSHPSVILFNSAIVLLWYFVGWKKCYPISLFFAQLLLTVFFMIILFTFFIHVWSEMAVAFLLASSNSNNT